MVPFDVTFVVGVLILLYLSSFVFFAILRVLTGISIQRVGYFSVRRLAYNLRDGIKVEVRGLGLNLHRPTFSQPTWLSIVITELVVTVDFQELEDQKQNAANSDDNDRGGEAHTGRTRRPRSIQRPPAEPARRKPLSRRTTFGSSRSETWKLLTRIKERLKKLHRNIHWLRMVDVVATNSTVNVVDVGNVQIGSFTIAVDTRRRMVDRARYFFQTRADKRRQYRPAEWIATMRSVLFTANGGEPVEVLDNFNLNVHGFLYERLDGLRDASIALKLGRVHVPYDDIRFCAQRWQQLKAYFAKSSAQSESFEARVNEVIQEIERPGSTDQDIVQTVSDSKEFVSSILRGIKEVQFAASFVSLTKKIHTVKTSDAPLLLNTSMKEVGIDLHRLDPKSPAHRMYFPSKDIAHEALAAAMSISVGLDDGQGKPERVFYVPMATTTVKTTLPSKTVELPQEGSAEEKNANILFANSVVTSPSLDLDPKHIPVLLALLRPRPKSHQAHVQRRHRLISRLLPKANIKFSMHEPVIRVTLPPVQTTDDPDDFDLIISSISSISLDVESFHSTVEEQHYSLVSSMRIQTHHLYYQTVQGNRFDLIDTGSFDLKVSLSATPDVNVTANGQLQHFAIRLARPEIIDGLRQIVRHLRLNVEPNKHGALKTQPPRHYSLRTLPQWLLHFYVQVDDFSVEVAGTDESFPNVTRGVAVQVDAWSAEYRAQRLDQVQNQPTSRRRAASRTMNPDTDLLRTVPSSPKKSRLQNFGDGRRVAVHIRGLDAFVVESVEKWEADPFIHMPRFEVAFSTLSDAHGPIFHVHSHVRTVLMQYSLFRHYSMGIAVTVLRKAFLRGEGDAAESRTRRTATRQNRTLDHLAPASVSADTPDAGTDSSTLPVRDLLTVDIRAALIQLKMDMPADPPMMLQIHSIEAGRHRWSPPFLQSKLVRLYAEAPRMRGIWARLASMKSVRLDYREYRKKLSHGGYQEDKLFDVVTEATRLAVPHELIINKISDNFINVFKVSQQLHHRFRTGTNEYILDRTPQSPKEMPKVSLRTRSLLLELEDGAFEWKLGLIYRAGRVEQTQRLAREEAFRVKKKAIQEEEIRKEARRLRNRSALGRERRSHANSTGVRSRSADDRLEKRNESEESRGRTPRYDPEEVFLSGSAHVSIQEARRKLDEHNAQSWKKRIDYHFSKAQDGMQDLCHEFYGIDQLPDDHENTEVILEIPRRPALMCAVITDLHVMLDKPSFPIGQLPDFLHKVGKGMPKDMKYSLLIPMNVQVTLGEARLSLRDYPLPILHVPAIKSGQSARLSAMSLKTDFVIAEEFRGTESTRRIRVTVTPPTSLEPGALKEGSFTIDVRRTIGPVKSYSDIQVDINTAYPTRITWGPSYQPAIQDMMMAIESFTKPQLDPSDRVGFWDKIRLNFHTRVRVAWRGGGDVHLALKGTRDPYHVTGNGAGFLMCWRKDVRWNIHTDDDPKRFMIVDSGEYVLAIPDYSHQEREMACRFGGNQSMASESSFKPSTSFQKVAMKLSGNVQWMAGLMFERAVDHDHRNFDFKPHYEVVLKAPRFAKADGDLPYDAFRGFRSQHIHLSLAVSAPRDRDWRSSGPQASRSYNTVHLTPRFFTHFFNWWSLFGGPLSLPIRQGSLWPGREKNTKKFGRHLGTIKYNLLLAPLFLSHIYKHKDADEYSDNSVSATGVKVRFDSWMLDLHQRREEFNTRDRGRKTKARTTGMKIHAAQLDLAAADIRAVSASIKGMTEEATRKQSPSFPLASQVEDVGAELSQFLIPDKDFSWIDMDDFVELDWILPAGRNPDTQILPLAYAPRLTYFRQTDIGGTIAGDPDRTSPFGHEPTHFCIMSQDDDPRRVQSQLMKDRLDQLATQIENNIRNAGEAELRMIRDNGNDPDLRVEFETISRHANALKDKRAFMTTMMEQISTGVPGHNHDSASQVDEAGQGAEEARPEGHRVRLPTGAEFASDFTNRFVVHNMQMKWNNLLRNIILRYIHQVSQRRGFVYYLSRPAVKFILDIVEEQMKAKHNRSGNSPDTRERSTPTDGGGAQDVAKDIEQRIRQILQDGRKFVHADESNRDPNAATASMDDITGGIAGGFSPQSTYHVRLIAPQIQLQSEKNKKHVVLVTAKGMDLKTVEVMDKARMSDMISGLVQRRFLVAMDSTQFFVTHKKWFSGQVQSMYSGNTYGTPLGSSWPPWVPMEVMYDFLSDPFGFKRVVQKTSAMLRYDKYNTLRLKYNDEVNTEATQAASTEGTERRVDNLWVEFPQARALCNSSQYYAIYVIVLDLLMYNEPLEKTRSERLEKIMLASDFSDLRGIPEMVTKLQERIRQLEDIKAHFQIHSVALDKKGWQDRMLLERDLAACGDELFFMMKAITTSQGKYDSSQSNALLRWSIAAKEIVWHLIRDNNEPLVELQLRNVEYDRTDNSDGSHINLFQVGKVLGLNLLPDAIYPEMIAPYTAGEKISQNKLEGQQMIRVYWHMLEAIAGIPVMDHFEVNLFPLKVQLEREVGKKLFEYVFPGIGGDRSNGGKGTDSPFMLRHQIPGEVDDATMVEESVSTSGSRMDSLVAEREPAFATRAGSLELRLRPTLDSDPRTPGPHPQKPKALSVHSGDGHMFRLFGRKPSNEYLQLNGSTPRPGAVRTSTTVTAQTDRKKQSRFALRSKPNSEDKPSDDLTKMMARASEYMTFAYIKMPSVVLCLSYKGKGDRNFEDVHDFVFRLPMIEYRNKTWSNLDLALALKSRIIKALISHTGAIIGNKFSRTRPTTEQQSKLRELATSSVLLATPALSASGDNSDDSSSLFANSPIDYSRSPPRSQRGSQSSMPADRSASRSSSLASSRSHRRPSNSSGKELRGLPGPPGFLMMTPPSPQGNKTSTGLGIDWENGPSSSNSRLRPESSALDLAKDKRRSSGGSSYLRGKLNALTSRLKDREGGGGGDARSAREADDGEDQAGGRLSRSPRAKTG